MMNRRIYTILLLWVFMGCSGPRVVYDYDDQINFGQFRSYALFPDLESGLSMLDERRLLEAVESQLQEQNISHSTTPDLYLNVFTETYEEPSQNRLGVGISGGSGGLGVGVSGGIPVGGPDRYLVLVFDLIDARADQLIWQAEVEGKFNPSAAPEKRREWFKKAVEKALSAYPPKD